jgi:peptide deformylase
MNGEVLTYGHPALREKAEAVAQIDGGIRRLAQDLLRVMYRSNGIGLAAQQIGRREAVCVIDLSGVKEAAGETEAPSFPPPPMPLIMVNPKITAMSGEQRVPEGCLSFPEIFVPLKRATEVTVAFTDLEGGEQTVSGRGLLARAIQHELDHLNGVLLVDRMSVTQKVALAGKLRRLRAEATAELTV